MLAHKLDQPLKREKTMVKSIFNLVPSPDTIIVIPCAFMIYFANGPPNFLYFINCEPCLAAIFIIRIKRADNFTSNIPAFAEVKKFIGIFKRPFFNRKINLYLFRNFNRLARM